MAKFGAQPINDVSKGQPKVIYRAQTEGSAAGITDERIDRRPQGKVERFVDPQGNVMNIQLSPAGNPNMVATADATRMRLRREGFVEHAKCPLKHGIRHTAPAIEKDFDGLEEHADLIKPCNDDPQVMRAQGSGARKVLFAQTACPHIEWLIAKRRKNEKEENERRNAHRAMAEKLEQEKRELQALQLEEAREKLKTAKAGKAKSEAVKP